MRILIADKFDASGLEALENRNFEVFFEPGLTADDLAKRQTEVKANVIVVRSTKVSSEVIGASQDLAPVSYTHLTLPTILLV